MKAQMRWDALCPALCFSCAYVCNSSEQRPWRGGRACPAPRDRGCECAMRRRCAGVLVFHFEIIQKSYKNKHARTLTALSWRSGPPAACMVPSFPCTPCLRIARWDPTSLPKRRSRLAPPPLRVVVITHEMCAPGDLAYDNLHQRITAPAPSAHPHCPHKICDVRLRLSGPQALHKTHHNKALSGRDQHCQGLLHAFQAWRPAALAADDRLCPSPALQPCANTEVTFVSFSF